MAPTKRKTSLENAVSQNSPKVSASLSAHLDCIRGVAAFAVLLAHARIILFVGYQEADHHHPLRFLFYFITSFGNSAVMIFFVLSGFLVGGSILKLVREDRWSWREYAFRRLTRLLIVLIPALILGKVLDSITIAQFGEHIQTKGGGILYPTPYLLNWNIFFGNLFFLQGILVPVLGSNGPLWSLSYEFWYYLIFPILCLAIFSKKSKVIRAVYFLVGCAMLYFVGAQISIYFVIWLLGVSASLIKPLSFAEGSRGWQFFQLGSTAIFVVILALASRHHSEVYWDLSLGLGFSLFIYALKHRKIKTLPQLYQCVAHRLAGFSYTLYLVHTPLLVWFGQLVLTDRRLQVDLKGVIIYLGVVLAATLYALLISRFTEAKTDKIRLKLMGNSSTNRERQAVSTAVPK